MSMADDLLQKTANPASFSIRWSGAVRWAASAVVFCFVKDLITPRIVEAVANARKTLSEAGPEKACFRPVLASLS